MTSWRCRSTSKASTTPSRGCRVRPPAGRTRLENKARMIKSNTKTRITTTIALST